MGIADVRRVWPDVLERIKTLRRFTWIMLSQNAQVQALDGSTLTIALVNAGARDSFVSSGSAEIVQQALEQSIGVQWRIEAIVDPTADPRAGAPAAGQAPTTPPPEPPAEPAGEGRPAPGRGVGAPDSVRQAMREPAAPVEDPDAGVSPDDPVLEAESDPELLLSAELGARVIDEIRHDE